MNPVIGIIGGKGRMGALFADFFAQNGIEVLISDLYTDFTNRQLAEKSDIIIVSVPIEKTAQVIAEVLPYLTKNQAIMDFTSVKESPVKAMLKGNCEVLGLHPMFGNSNPIPGQTVIVCETKKSGKWSKWITDFLSKNNVQLKRLTAKEHDKVMNIAQGLIHFAEIVFADAIRRTKLPIKQLLEYTGKASELKVQLAARILDQDPGLYGNIQIQNPQALNSLKELLKSTDELFKIVKKKNLGAFEKYFLRTRKFLGDYTKDAYLESSYLIDKLMDLRKASGQKAKYISPTKKDVAILGPRNTFSDLAATQYLGKYNLDLNKYFVREISEVFELVAKEKVTLGIAPIENKIHGTVRETLDGLFNHNVHISDEFTMPIHHCLIGLSNSKLTGIKTIISHSQALNQCKKYLEKHINRAAKESVPSTAQAVEKLLISKDKSIAVIAPKQAANRPHLKVLATNIEDNKENCTTFVIVRSGKIDSSSKTTETKHNKTSIAFYFNKDAPGSLFTIFKDFADAKINLTKIESRPTKAAFGDYIFFLDFNGNLSDAKVKKTLRMVEKKVAKLKILGSY